MKDCSKIIVSVSGLSGSGKDWFVDNLDPKRFFKVQSYTTRPHRGERETGGYRHISEEEMSLIWDKMIQRFESDEGKYGCDESAFEDPLNKGRIPVIVVSPSGTSNLYKKLKNKFIIYGIHLRINEDQRLKQLAEDRNGQSNRKGTDDLIREEYKILRSTETEKVAKDPDYFIRFNISDTVGLLDEFNSGEFLRELFRNRIDLFKEKLVEKDKKIKVLITSQGKLRKVRDRLKLENKLLSKEAAILESFENDQKQFIERYKKLLKTCEELNEDVEKLASVEEDLKFGICVLEQEYNNLKQESLNKIEIRDELIKGLQKKVIFVSLVSFSVIALLGLYTYIF
jgi:guanylate kinase/archaellum component FlaC